MQERMLIGITGYLGTGKTTLARLLSEHPSLHGIKIQGLADAVKSDIRQAIRLMTGCLLTDQEVELYKSQALGSMYQGYGEFCRQIFGKDFWIKRLEENLAPCAIVHDIRYQNEAEWIRSEGGILLGIHGPRRRQDERDGQHPSEAEIGICLDLADVRVNNFLDYEGLGKEVNRVAEHILGVTTEMIPV